MTVDTVKLQALLDAAKVAEWGVAEDGQTLYEDAGPDMAKYLGETYYKDTADLIVAAVNALPALLGVVAERDRLAAEVRETRQHWVSEYMNQQDFFAGCAGYEWDDEHDENEQLLGEHIEQTRKERDRLAAEVEAVRGMVGRFDRVTEVSGGRYDEGHVAGFHLAATIILAALDGAL